MKKEEIDRKINMLRREYKAIEERKTIHNMEIGQEYVFSYDSINSYNITDNCDAIRQQIKELYAEYQYAED